MRSIPPEGVEAEARLVHRGVGRVGEGGDGLFLIDRLAQFPVPALLRPNLRGDPGDPPRGVAQSLGAP